MQLRSDIQLRTNSHQELQDFRELAKSTNLAIYYILRLLLLFRGLADKPNDSEVSTTMYVMF